LHVIFEEGTWSAWLHDLLKPHVARVVVSDPRKNALLKDGSKNDRIDARKLSELLYLNKFNPVYHGEHGLRTLKELARSYLTITKDLTRVIGAYQSDLPQLGDPLCRPTGVFARSSGGVARETERNRRAPSGRILLSAVRWVSPFTAAGPARAALESRKHSAVKLLRQIPSIGPIRAALLW
jgi:hypothetical protein